MTETPDWEAVLQFWFPDRLDEDQETHNRHWRWRMRGGADEEIVARFSDLTAKAVAGDLDHWAEEPRGRLALIILLDQFPRSVWRGTPRAFAQDEKALALALEGYENSHYEALEVVWEKTVYNLPLGHCEGPDHLERCDLAVRLARDIHATAPDHLKDIYAFNAQQPVEIRNVIAAFGRHPHRNTVLGRISSQEEDRYIAMGQFPHVRAL
jgi:uncharacterized protein (DUF924 family)